MTARTAASAGLWSAIDFGTRAGMQFVVSLILARLLMPEDFGIIAMLTFFTSLSIVFVQGGLSTALVQRQVSTRDEESAVFWWNLLASLLFAGLLILIAPAVARYYEYPVLVSLMPVAAGQVVFSALGAVQNALLTRQLRFGTLAKAGIAATAISGACATWAAFSGLGVWALALQILGQAALYSTFLWLASDWRPKAHFRPGTIAELWRFGGWFSLSSVLEVLYTQGFALIIGKLYGARDLGLYNRASNTQLLPTTIISSIIGRIALPLMAARADDRASLRQGLKAANAIAMLINLPIMTGIALLSDLIVVVLFGEKWLPAAPLLAILAWGGLLFPLHVLNLQLLLAVGKANTYFRVEVIKKVFGIAAVAGGSFYGMYGLAWSQLVVGIVALFINVAPVGKHLDYGVYAQIRDLKGPILATVAMGAVVMPLRQFVAFGPLADLLILSAAGAAVYAAFCLAFRIQAFQLAVGAFASLLRARHDAPRGPADERQST